MKAKYITPEITTQSVIFTSILCISNVADSDESGYVSGSVSSEKANSYLPVLTKGHGNYVNWEE